MIVTIKGHNIGNDVDLKTRKCAKYVTLGYPINSPKKNLHSYCFLQPTPPEVESNTLGKVHRAIHGTNQTMTS